MGTTPQRHPRRALPHGWRRRLGTLAAAVLLAAGGCLQQLHFSIGTLASPAAPTAPSGPRHRLVARRGVPSKEVGKPPRNKPWKSKFTAGSKSRGTTGRGKKNHFELLDRYIRRIDALLPEDMEDLVRPLSYNPNLEQTTNTLKITLDLNAANVTEQDVRAFFAPEAVSGVALGYAGPRWQLPDPEAGIDAAWGNEGPEVYVRFASNENCREARRKDGEILGGAPCKVRFTVDDKYRHVCETLGVPEVQEVEVGPGSATQEGGQDSS